MKHYARFDEEEIEYDDSYDDCVAGDNKDAWDREIGRAIDNWEP